MRIFVPTQHNLLQLITTMKRLITIITLIAVVLTASGQTTVSGSVTDRKSGRPLAHVSILMEGEKIHTVTNDDGHFALTATIHPKALRLTHIGYKTLRYQLTEDKTEGLKLSLVPNSVQLSEIVVSAEDPLQIVKAAMSRIEQNYSQESELVRCFYRETARRGSRFISIAEAVTDMYKTGYSKDVRFDAVAILKGRRLMSMKRADTLGVKIQGGPVMPLVVDVAKNPDYLLSEDLLALCTFRMEQPAVIDDRPHYVVSIVPRRDTEFPMMGGLLYIDQQTLAFSRAELQLDVSDWRRASEYMLVRKPLGLRFRPKELSVTVVYKTDEQGITHMSYVRNEMRFNCDWKRRLFASPFTTVSEMVVTNRLQQGRDAQRPRGRSSFGIKERFYDRVEYFEDPDFWAGYNIIEPTESLENAIGKLKKKHD